MLAHTRLGVNWRKAPDSELPATCPHGEAWATLTNDELARRADWAMTGAHHEALRRERLARVAQDFGTPSPAARPNETPRPSWMGGWRA